MCNVIDGKCEYVNLGDGPHYNPYHGNPTLHYQIRGELIELHSATKKVKIDDPEYGFKLGALRKRTADKIVAICEAELKLQTPESEEAANGF